jgi:hypothetical protein
MKKTCLLLCLGLITSLGAVEPAPAITPSLAQKPLPSPAQIELAQKVIKATQMDRMFDQMSAQMQQMAAQSIGLAAPNQTPAQKEAAMKYMGEVMKLSMDSAKSLMTDFDLIFAEVYSETELKAMLAFYESAEGKSMLQKQPLVMQHLMPLVQDMQKTLMPKIQEIAQKAKAEAAAAAPTAPTNAKVD